MPTCEKYAHVAGVSLSLLDRYWPGHPPVHVIHSQTVPILTVHSFPSPFPDTDWVSRLWHHLMFECSSEVILLTLDDYALCRPVNPFRLRELHGQFCSSDIDGLHLTYQPCVHHGETVIPYWDYIISTQAAYWRRDVLVELLGRFRHNSIWEFELSASRWWRVNKPVGRIVQASMAVPPRISGFVDEMDKSDWPFPYHNLYRQGHFDSRHAAFMAQEGFPCP